MSKRLHDTEIWGKQWFRSLSCEAKLLWMYLKDKCTCAGIVEIDDEKQTEFFIGKKISEKTFNELKKQFIRIDSKRLFLLDFIEFQYGYISPVHKMYKRVMSELVKFAIKYPIDRVPTVLDTVMVMDKDMVMDKGECEGEGKPVIKNVDADPLDPEWSSYLKMRIVIRKPATEEAMRLAKIELEKFAPKDTEKQKAILNQSIMHSWQGLFPLRGVDNGSENRGVFRKNAPRISDEESRRLSEKYGSL